MTQKTRVWFCFSGAFCLWAGSLLAAVPVTNGLKFHVDASATETITMDAGGKVAQWNDLSGNGYPVVQGTESRKPVYRADGLDGYPSVSFNGSNLLAASTAFINYSNHTVFVVAKAAASANGDFVGSATDFSSVGDILLMANYNCAFRGIVRWGSNGTDYTYASSATDDQTVPLIYEQAFGNASLKLRLNGKLEGQVAVTNEYTAVTRSVSLGGRTEFLSKGQCFQGELSEVLIYDRELGMAERVAVANYLKVKWLPGSTAITLPPVTDGLKFMADARVVESLTTNALGGVAQWNDLSGVGYPVVQSVENRKPVYRSDGLDGYPSVSFNGSNLLAASTAFINYSNHTVFVVAKTSVSANGDLLASSSDFSSVGDILLMANYNNHAFRGSVRWGAGGYAYAESVSGKQTVPLIYEQAFGDALLKIRVNGSAEAMVAITNVFTAVTRSIYLGGRTQYLTAGQCFWGDISEVLIYERELSQVERVAVVNHLKNRWLPGSVATTLPPVVRGLKFMGDAKVKDSLVMDSENRVSNWRDLSGNALPIGQTTNARKPVSSVGINGLPSLFFNGSNVLCGTTAYLCYSNHTVFVVAKATGQTYAGNDLFGGGDATPGSVIVMNHLRGDYQGLYFTEGSQYAKVTSTGAATLSAAVYEQWLDSANLRLYRDGASHGSTPVSSVRTNVLKKVSLGYRQDSSPGGSGFIGEISEVLVYDVALTAEERQQTESYLYEKWIMPRKGTVIYLR